MPVDNLSILSDPNHFQEPCPVTSSSFFSTILKRDGSTAPFDPAKIRSAVGKAAAAVESQASPERLGAVVDEVLAKLAATMDPESTPQIEQVQDLVENSLMESGLFKEAKAYILYRAKRHELREYRHREAMTRLRQQGLTILADDGSRQTLDVEWLTDSFRRAARGLGDAVDVPVLVDRLGTMLFEGMPLADVKRAMVLTARALVERDPSYSKVAARLLLDSIAEEVAGSDPLRNDYEPVRRAFVSHVKSAVDTGRLDTRLLSFDLPRMAAAMDFTRDGLFELMGVQTLYDRYFLREEAGERRLEGPQGFWMRVAMGLAMDEAPDQRESQALRFYEVMSSLRYVPSTPTLFHAGTTFPQLSSCYLNTVEDDLQHIFKVYGDNAQLSKYSGGIGTDWSNIRGTGAHIKTTNVGSQGVVPFLKIANDVTVAINRSGKRRGAACAYLETWHYDIEDFLDLRKNTGDERRRTHDMNTANWIPDLFMKRVQQDGNWTLFSPDEVADLHHLYGRAFEERYTYYEAEAAAGRIHLSKTIQARALWRRMLTMLFETGHPWITWKDACNVRSPQDHAGVIHCSNLCTEITLNTSREETAVCNLGSVNLSRHVTRGVLDRELVADTVAVAMRMLDNVIDLNFYPTAEAKTSNLRHRPVGLGIMGFQDALYELGFDWESEQTLRFADESMELVAYHAILNSSRLARERGAYSSFKGSKWDRGLLPQDTLDLLEQERGMKIDIPRGGSLDWTPVREHIREYGMRNSNCMAIAPTATISNISGCLPCIEPIYKNLYVKSNMSGDFTVVNRFLVQDLKARGLWDEDCLAALKASDGSLQVIDGIPEDLKARYKEAFEVDPQWLVRIAAYRGKWIDQSQSYNIFLKGTSGKVIQDTYFMAWELGLKTTYYLRSLGASTVEKATVSLKRQSIVTGGGQGGSATPAATQPKACLLDDPTCEACQ
jgi:ribonucleoside-diphosphate reductase alpha chain